MNVPARYCTGYLGDIGVPADPNPMDFSAWFEVYLGGRWYTFDARQYAACRAHSDGARTRCHRCCDRYFFRTLLARELQGHYGRSSVYRADVKALARNVVLLREGLFAFAWHNLVARGANKRQYLADAVVVGGTGLRSVLHQCVEQALAPIVIGRAYVIHHVPLSGRLQNFRRIFSSSLPAVSPRSPAALTAAVCPDK